MASTTGESLRVPLYWLWNEQQTDSAYTVSADRRDRMVREQGYVDMGVLAYIDLHQAQDSRPLKCFYSPAPRTNTFCSTSRTEQRTIHSFGYQHIGDEGYVRTRRAPGTVPLFRLNRAYGNGEDREHRFTTSEVELERLRKQAWTLDGTKGYVFTMP